MEIKMQQRSNHIEILDFLRGMAALTVVMFHYSRSSIASIKPNAFTDFFTHGNLGVQVFFVISGFVIPYAMQAMNYNYSSLGIFLGKRFLRICPPSYVIIILTMLLYYSAIWILDRPIAGMAWPGVSWNVIAGNLTYMYNLFNSGAYIDVFWTLEIEFQFYFVMALLYPLLISFSSNPIRLSLLLAVLSATAYMPASIFPFFGVNSYFVLGILLFLYSSGYIGRNYFIYTSAVSMLLCIHQQSTLAALAGVCAFLVIRFVSFKHPVTTFLGNISYSLYITHIFSGAVLEIALNRLIGNSFSLLERSLLLWVYAGFAIVFAWLFHKWIEKPCMRLASRIGKKGP